MGGATPLGEATPSGAPAGRAPGPGRRRKFREHRVHAGLSKRDSTTVPAANAAEGRGGEMEGSSQGGLWGGLGEAASRQEMSHSAEAPGAWAGRTPEGTAPTPTAARRWFNNRQQSERWASPSGNGRAGAGSRDSDFCPSVRPPGTQAPAARPWASPGP